jgi:DNA-binding response OmpR family regulator
MKKKPRKILLIEDNESITLAYKKGFKRAGFNLFHMINGTNVISNIEKYKPDIILLDLIMPKRNGFEVLEDIKKNKKFEYIPLIVLTNLEEDFYLKSIEEYCVTELLLKISYSMKEIIERINNILDKKSL